MSNFVKPQSPIYNKSTDTYIYPLTTSDQVIMPDGSRFDAENIGGMKMELLWENASPTSEFAAQTISLDLSNYDAIDLYYRTYTSFDMNTGYYRCPVGKNQRATTSSEFIYIRDCNTTIHGVTFRDAEYVATYGSANYTTYNSILIPIKIYGIKGVN